MSATSPRRPRGDTTPPLRAPGDNGGILAVPPLAEAGRLLAVNRRRLETLENTPGPLGRPWSDLRRQARRAAVAAARDYLARHGEPLPAGVGVPPSGGLPNQEPPSGGLPSQEPPSGGLPSQEPPEGGTPTSVPDDAADAGLLLAGHQPELFHPGVWVKNFALAGLARAHGRIALNLVVDNDSVKSTALRVPAPAEDDRPPRLVGVPFDRWSGGVPYEERAVEDAALFDTFADRAMDLMRGWHFEPLLPELWAEVRRRREAGGLLGDCFASARRGLERAWGCHNLEVPLSALCRTEPFAWFACHLLAELPRFGAIYNAAVHDYRVRNHIRSSNHPVPDLAEEDGWLEAPFWGWRAGQERRGRLFARRRNGHIELRAGSEPWPALPAPEAGQEDETVAAWSALEGRGFKARSRALTTTLFARVFLAELFLHGIGGGKYDELTDELIRRFYGVEPAGFLVLSATLWLPLGPPPAADLAGERRRLARTARDLYWNPQRHLDEDGAKREAATGALAAEKAGWIARQPQTPAERRRRFQVLRELTEQLRRPLQPRAEALVQELARCDRRLEAEAVLRRRDYSFCLYPAATLRPFCEQFLHLRT